MRVFIAFLRGINVGGHHKIKMTDLQNTLSKLSYKNVQTYLQSGNVIFEFSDANPLELQDQIAAAILSDFGHKIKVIVLSREHFMKAYKHLPSFDETDSENKSYVVFLDRKANPDVFLEIKNAPDHKEKMILNDQIIYVHYSNGYGNSKINNNFFERKLNLVATTRNRRTVRNLFERLTKM